MVPFAVQGVGAQLRRGSGAKAGPGVAAPAAPRWCYDLLVNRDPMGTASFLAQTALLGGLSADELMFLGATAATVQWPQGHTVFHKGEPGDEVFIVRSGLVRILLPADAGREATLAFMYPGSLFGELSLLDGGPRSATAVAVEDTLAIRIKREPFMVFLRRQPGAGAKILAALAQRLRRADELLYEALLEDVPAAVVAALQALVQTRGVQTAEGITVPFDATGQGLAAETGLAADSIRRGLRLLRAWDVLDYESDRVVIRQPEALRWLADDEPAASDNQAE